MTLALVSYFTQKLHNSVPYYPQKKPTCLLLSIFSVDGQFCICVAAELLDRRRRIVMYAKSLSLCPRYILSSFNNPNRGNRLFHIYIYPRIDLFSRINVLILSLPLPRRPLPVPQFSLDSRSSCSMCVLCAAVSA